MDHPRMGHSRDKKADRRPRRSSTSPAPPTSIASATRRAAGAREPTPSRTSPGRLSPEPSRARRGEWRGGEGRPRSRRENFEPGRPREGSRRTQPGNHEIQPAGWFRARCQNDRARPPPATAFLAGTPCPTTTAARASARTPRRRRGNARRETSSASKATTTGGVRGRALLFPHLERRESVRAHEPRVVAQRRFLLLRRRRGRDRLVRHLRVRVRARRARGRSGRRRTPTLEPTAECSSGERHETAARGFARLGTRRPDRDERRVFYRRNVRESFRESRPNANANANANAKTEEEEEEQPFCVGSAARPRVGSSRLRAAAALRPREPRGRRRRRATRRRATPRFSPEASGARGSRAPRWRGGSRTRRER